MQYFAASLWQFPYSPRSAARAFSRIESWCKPSYQWDVCEFVEVFLHAPYVFTVSVRRVTCYGMNDRRSVLGRSRTSWVSCGSHPAFSSVGTGPWSVSMFSVSDRSQHLVALMLLWTPQQWRLRKKISLFHSSSYIHLSCYSMFSFPLFLLNLILLSSFFFTLVFFFLISSFLFPFF
jgi:hypothetical protein